MHARLHEPRLDAYAALQRCFERQLGNDDPLVDGQLAQLSGVAAPELDGLIDYGVLAVTAPEHEPATFDIGFVMTLQRAQRLRQDLALDDHAFALAVMLLQQIAELEEEVRTMRSDAQRCLAEPTH